MTCEHSGLPDDQCSHCRPPVAEPDILPEAIARFAARFDSECDHCGGPMSEGDPICRTRDGGQTRNRG